MRENYLKKIRGFYHDVLIKVITGIRRCGKSSFLKSIIKELLENGLTIRTRIDIYVKLAFLYDVSIDYLLGINTVKGEFPNDMKDEVIEKYNIDLYLVKRLREKGTFQDLQKDKSTAPSP